MDSIQAAQAINARWIERWPGLSGDVPYALDNISRPEAETFAQLSITNTMSDQWTLGPTGKRKWLRSGMLEVRLTGKVGVGRKGLDLLGNDVRAIFEGVRFGVRVGEMGIVTHASTVNELRRDRDATRVWIIQVVTPFEYYEVR